MQHKYMQQLLKHVQSKWNKCIQTGQTATIN